MGRSSKLTTAQWSDIERRLAAGAEAVQLAREFGIHSSQITRRFGKAQAQIAQRAQDVSQHAQKVALDAAKLLPPSHPIHVQLASAREMAADAIRQLAAAAQLSAGTAHKAHRIANQMMAEVDETAPMKSLEQLKFVAAMTKTGNEAASIGLTLLGVNRDAVALADEADRPEEVTQIELVGLEAPPPDLFDGDQAEPRGGAGAQS